MRKTTQWVMLAMLAGGAVPTLQAASVEQRLERLERVVDSQSLLEMLERLDTLQREVQMLRGQVEEQQHTIKGLKERQRDLYLDIDRRMSRIEREGVSAAPTTNTGESIGATQPLTAGAASQSITPVTATVNEQTSIQDEREAYQQAFDMLRELRYAQATEAFRNFLKQYPDSRYAHIAQYWLGEAGYAQRDFRQAIADYNALIENHPQSPKLAEAMLKIGYSHYELKEAEKAREVLEQLVQKYPDSTEAGQARNLLKRINKNGG